MTEYDANGNEQTVTEYAADGTTPTKKTYKRSDGTTSQVTEYDANGSERTITEVAEDGMTPTKITDKRTDGTMRSEMMYGHRLWPQRHNADPEDRVQCPGYSTRGCAAHKGYHLCRRQ